MIVINGHKFYQLHGYLLAHDVGKCGCATLGITHRLRIDIEVMYSDCNMGLTLEEFAIKLGLAIASAD